jgi:hypothetical protein
MTFIKPIGVPPSFFGDNLLAIIGDRRLAGGGRAAAMKTSVRPPEPPTHSASISLSQREISSGATQTLIARGRAPSALRRPIKRDHSPAPKFKALLRVLGVAPASDLAFRSVSAL